MPDYIRIAGLEVYAHHGVFPAERAAGQTFLVDLTFYLDLKKAGVSDRLEATVDYGEIAQQAYDLVARTSHDLIETVAEDIAAMVLENHAVESVEVTVHKPQAPIAVPFADVSVTIRRP